jgi:adenylate cyclase
LPLAVPLLAILLSTVGAFAWSYFTEDRQRRMILKALAQYVSPAVADRIARDPTQVNLGGERRDMTVMFTDLKNFTNMTESMQVEDLTRMINYYFREMSEVVLKVDGTVDKYIGDAIMSFWNAPVEQADHALLACRAALGMQQREREIRPELEKLGAKDLLTRIGLNSGTMAVGNMGSERKLNYTVLGDSVNFASRLEGANKFYGTQILMAESTAKLVRDHVVMRQVDVLRVKGKKQPMAVFELMGEGAAGEGLKPLAQRYERAFDLYRRQQWEAAEAELAALLAEHPNDGPATTLMARIARFRQEPPPADWDGVYEAKDK